jgi:hypothetical protein
MIAHYVSDSMGTTTGDAVLNTSTATPDATGQCVHTLPEFSCQYTW